MSEQSEEFQSAVVAAKQLPEKPDDDTLLQLYALYKQSTEGDVSGEKPGFFDFVGQAKYDAWERLRGTPQNDAQERYVQLVRDLGGEVS